jgi:hypothetical protein
MGIETPPSPPADPTVPDVPADATAHDEKTGPTAEISRKAYGSRDPRPPPLEPVADDDPNDDFEGEEPTQVGPAPTDPHGWFRPNRHTIDVGEAEGPERTETEPEVPRAYEDYLRDALDFYLDVTERGPGDWELSVERALRDARDFDDMPKEKIDALEKRLLAAKPGP